MREQENRLLTAPKRFDREEIMEGRKEVRCSEKEAAYMEQVLLECRKQELFCIKEVRYPDYVIRYMSPVKKYLEKGGGSSFLF